MKTEYPKEFFINLNGEDFLDGRLTVNLLQKGFMVEVDLVQKISRKIFRHIDSLYYYSDEREALDFGMQALSRFLNSARETSSN